MRHHTPALPAAFATLLAVLAGSSFAEQLNFTAYTNTEGLPQHQVLALAQDGTGYLWVGTYGGLSRFDGYRFTTLTTRNGLSANGVRDIVVAPDGTVWAATLGGGVCSVRGLRVVRCVHLADRLGTDYVTDLELGPDGSLWIATDQGIARLSAGGKLRTFDTDHGLPSRQAWSVRLLKGALYACTAAGLARFDPGRSRWTPVSGAHLRNVRTVATLGGDLILGTEHGLFRLTATGVRRIAVPGEPRRGFFVVDTARSGDIVWIATRSGVVRLDDRGVARRLTAANGLLSDIVHRVMVDREHNLWLGTDDGLCKLTPGPITVWDRRDGLPHPFVRAIAEDVRHRVWFATRHGIAILDERGFEVIPGERLPNPRVYALAPLADGTVLAGTGTGLVRLRGTRVLGVWHENDGLPVDFVLAAAPTRDGTGAWIGTNAGTVLWRDGRLVTPPLPIASARPTAMALGPEGHLWIGLRAGGVLVTDGKRILRRLSAENGLTDQIIWSLDHDGSAVWIGSNGDGAFRIAGDRIDHWDRERGLADEFVWSVLCDRNGSVWFYTSQGLDRLVAGRIRHYGKGDGLVDLEGSAGAAYQGSDGILWFGSGAGLVRFDPKLERPVPRPAPVVIQTVRSNRYGDIAPGARLEPPSGVLTFRFVSLTYRDTRSVRYRHRLLPVEREWSAPQREPWVRLASVGPGNYRFEVIAENDEGRKTPEATAFRFTVLAPWWRRPTALALWLLLLVAGGFGAVRWRTARLERERERLERLVVQRTEELARRAEEMQRLAVTDELTGVANRRHLFEVLRSELQRLARSPRDARLALAVMDLDGFKQVNDTWGHNVGDKVLREIAQAIRGCLRETDLVARFGGDEFAIVLPLTDREGAHQVCARVLEAVRNLDLSAGPASLGRITASVGIAVVAPSAPFDDAEVERLVQRADTALYQAKRLGGNRVLDDFETWA